MVAIEGILDLEGTLVQEEILGRGKCIRQLALSADRNVKFLSSREKAGQFSAETAIPKKGSFRAFCSGIFV